MNGPMYIPSERQRRLQDLTWTSGLIVSRDLPRDTVLKRINLRLYGSLSYTFSSSPVAYEVSTFDNLVSRLDVVVAGSRTVKSVRPWLLRMEQLLFSTVQADRRASAGAAAAAQNYPLTDGGFVYGTTTQYTTVNEVVSISFEMILCAIGRNGTYLNLKGAPSAEIRVACGTTAGLDKTTNATFANAAFTIEAMTVEAQDIPPQVAFSDWKQTTKDIVFTAQTTDYAIDINRGNFLTGLKLFAVQDYGAAQSTASLRKQPTNFAIDTIKLQLNGSLIIKSTTFKSLQAENRTRFGVNAPMASSQSVLDGFAYLDLLEMGDLRTALDARPPKVDNLQLLISTLPSDSTYNNYNVGLTVETGELVTPR